MAMVLVTFPERKVTELTTLIECKNGQTPSCKIKKNNEIYMLLYLYFLER